MCKEGIIFAPFSVPRVSQYPLYNNDCVDYKPIFVLNILNVKYWTYSKVVVWFHWDNHIIVSTQCIFDIFHSSGYRSIWIRLIYYHLPLSPETAFILKCPIRIVKNDFNMIKSSKTNDSKLRHRLESLIKWIFCVRDFFVHRVHFNSIECTMYNRHWPIISFDECTNWQI